MASLFAEFVNRHPHNDFIDKGSTVSIVPSACRVCCEAAMANAHEAWHWIDFETYREAFIISGLNYINIRRAFYDFTPGNKAFGKGRLAT